MKRSLLHASYPRVESRFRRRRKLLPNCNLTAVFNAKNSAIASKRFDVSTEAPEGEDPQPALQGLETGEQVHASSDAEEDTVPTHDDRQDTARESALGIIIEDVTDTLQLEESGQSDENPHESDDEETKPKHALMPWTNLYSLLSVCGSVRFTAKQHALLCLTVRWCSGYTIPSYRTVRRSLFPFLLQHCFPGSKLYRFPIGGNSSESEDNCEDEQQRTTLESGRHSCVDVRIVLPTEWAKIDVMTYTLYESMRTSGDNYHGHCKNDWALHSSKLIRTRADLLQPTNNIFVETSDGSETARKRDQIAVKISEVPTQVRRELPATSYVFEPLDRGQQILHGDIAHVWCTKNRDQSDAQSLNILQWLRPEQKVLVTETSAFSNMQALTNINGTGIYPGDICALINPRQGCETEWMCVLANRFCTAQSGSASRCILWVRQESEGGPQSWKSHIQTAFKVKKRECETSSTD